MPSRAFTLSKTRLQSNKLTRTLRSNFSAQPDVRSAAVLGNKLIAVGGSLYDSTVGSDEVGNAVAVVNVGRPAAAVYAPSSGGAAVVSISGGGGGGSGATSFSQLAGTISDGQAPQFLKTDGSRALLGNLSATDGVTIDGVDISAHAANPNAHHNWQHSMTSAADHVYSGGNALDVFGLSATSTLGVLTPSFDPGAASAILRTNSLGNLTLESLTTPLLKSAGVQTWTPGTRIELTAGKEIRTTDSVTGFLGAGWRLTNTSGHGFLDIREIQVEELHAYQFVADIERVRVGETFVTQSMAILKNDMTTPSINSTTTMTVEDVPQAVGGVFLDNEWVLLQLIDRSGGGLTIARAWGQVSTYVDNGDGTQSWTYTHKHGTAGLVFKAGSYVLDFGASGDAYIHESVIDSGGSPYLRMATWVTDPSVESNRTVRVQLGNLDSITDTDLEPNGYGLYADNTFLKGDFLTGNGDIRMYQSSGLNFQEGDNEVFASLVDRRAIQWWPDVANIGVSDLPSFNIGASLPTSGGYAGVNMAGIELFPTNGEQAVLFQIVHGAGVDNTAQIYMQGRSSGGTAPLIRLSATDVVLDGTTTVDNIIPSNVNTPNNLGTNSNRFDTIYANEIIAGTLTADVTSGDTLSGNIWENDASNMTIESDSSSDRVLYVTNPGTGKMDLNVDNDIILGGLVDGVDVSAFKASYDGHTHAHSALTGLTSGDNHTQYVHISTARTITAQHSFSPGSAQAPFALGSNAQGQTVTGLKADQLNKQVIAGSGLSGTGTLTSDVTLALLWGTPTISTITPDASAAAGTSANPARSDHTHAIVAAAPSANLTVSTTNAEGVATSFARSDHSHAITSSSAPGAAAQILSSTSAGGLTLQSLNIGSVGSISTAGVVTMADDVDTVHKLGRTALGHASYADYAAFSHRDMSAAGQYGVLHDAAGVLYLNTTTGNTIYHRVNNADVMQMTSQRLNPAGSAQIDLGDYNRKWRTLYASELYVEVLVAQSVMATIGGRIMVAPTTKLIADVNSYQSYIDVKDNDLFNGDYIRMETAPSGVPQAESMRITSDPVTITGGFRYNVLRAVNNTFGIVTTASMTNSQTTINLSVNYITSSSYLYLVATGSPLQETIQITSGPTTVSGGYRYNCTRNITGTGAQAWASGVNAIYTALAWTSGDAIVSLAGGASSLTTLIANVTVGATTMDVGSSGLTNGASYFLQTSTQYEVVTVTSAPTTVTGGYRYTITRNVNGGGAKAWSTGAGIHAVSQQTGRGYIDLTSTATIHNALGPTQTIYTRTGTTGWNDVKPVTTMGNLRSFVDYTADTFGWGVGNDLTLSPTGGFSGMTGDAVNGLRQFNTITKMYNAGTEFSRMDTTNGYSLMAYTGTSSLPPINGVTWYRDAIASNKAGYVASVYDNTSSDKGNKMYLTSFDSPAGASHSFVYAYGESSDDAYLLVSGGKASLGIPSGVTMLGTTVSIASKVYISNTGTPGTPSLGGYLYVSAGALWFKGSAGTNTKIANA